MKPAIPPTPSTEGHLPFLGRLSRKSLLIAERLSIQGKHWMGKADTPGPGSSVFCGIGVPFDQAYAVIGLKMSCELITVPSPIDEGAVSFSSLASQGRRRESSAVLLILLGGCFSSDLLTVAGTCVDCAVPFHWRCG